MDTKWTSIRRVSAVVFALSFFLPLAQCSIVKRTEMAAVRDSETTTSSAADDIDFNAPVETSSATAAGEADAPNSDIAAFSAFSVLSLGGITFASLFFWPLAAELGQLFRRTRHRLVPFRALALCVLSVVGITWLVLWGQTIRYGAFVAYGSIAAYAIALVATFRPASPTVEPATSAGR